MAKKLPAKDVAIVGLGWTSAILAQDLTDNGLDVVAIERGPWRDTATSFNIGYAPMNCATAFGSISFSAPGRAR